MSTSNFKCNYIGCKNTPFQSKSYCEKHNKIMLRVDDFVPNINFNDPELQPILAQFNITILQPPQPLRPPSQRTEEDDKITQDKTYSPYKNINRTLDLDRLKQEIITPFENSKNPSNQLLKEKLHKAMNMKKTQTKTLKHKHKTKKMMKKIHRIITEKNNGEKIIEEFEESISEKKNITLSTKFKSEQEINMYVEESTELYTNKITEYAQNKELVFSSLKQWFQDIQKDISDLSREENVSIQSLENISMEQLLDNNYNYSYKESIVQWKLWDALWKEEKDNNNNNNTSIYLPILQSISFYTIEPLADGKRKVFQCQFSSSRTNRKILTVSVPEILLRAFKNYLPLINAFFISKFIPFKKLFMKHKMLDNDEEVNEEVNEELTNTRQNKLIEAQDEIFSVPSIPEINPCVCYYVVSNED